MDNVSLKFQHVKGEPQLSFSVICENDNDKNNIKTSLSVENACSGYIIRRKIENTAPREVKLCGLSAVLSGVDFGGESRSDYYYSNENGRLFGTFALPVDFDRTGENAALNAELGVVADTYWADPGTLNNKISDSVYQPFPAVLISNYAVKSGVVCGTLSQDFFYHNYELFHEKQSLFIKINSRFKDVAYRIIKSGEVLEDVFYVGSIDCADDFNRLFDDYTAVLRRFLNNNCGARQTNRHSLIWDSWNDGIYRNISEQSLLKEAECVKKLLPSVEWFQLDDGYSAYCDEDPDKFAHGIGTYYEKNHGVDLKKFPEGLKGYTEKLKKTGFKPAIWIGAVCPAKAQICTENPDWFLNYSYRFSDSLVLDSSKPCVREYMKNAIEWFVSQGFEGIKHDFWSYAFEDGHALLSSNEKSGYENREWWTKTIRSALGDGGYIGTACDMSMGNPFLGKYFNNYRFGIDVGGGKWLNIATTFLWGVCVLSTHTGDLFIPNCDSIGFLRNLNDVDYMFAVNFAIISRSFVETSGRFSSVSESDERLAILQRATKYLNNGENVYFAKFDYRKKGKNLPNILYLKSHFDSPEQNENFRTVALFNVTEQPITVEFSAADIELLGEKYRFSEVWTNEEVVSNGLRVTLSPHESRLYLVDCAKKQ